MSNLDVTDAYHRNTLLPSQVETFAYIILLVADDYCIIICIDLVLLMGRIDSPKFFYEFLETLTDVENGLVHMLLPVPGYGSIAKIPETSPVPPHTLDRLAHINCYMNDTITALWCGPE